MESIAQLLNIDPKLVTGVSNAFIGVCGALGFRELLAKFVDRYWKKEDEKDVDHKQIIKMQESIDEILLRLDKMEERDEESLVNDMLIIEDRLLWLQKKAIQVHKVSRKCMPRYQRLLKRYIELNQMGATELNEEVLFNDAEIKNIIAEGCIVETWEECLK